LGELVHFGDDLVELAPVVDPLAVALGLLAGEPGGDGFPIDLAGVLPVGAVPLRWVLVAVAAGIRADGIALDQAPGGDEADLEQCLAARLVAALQSRWARRNRSCCPASGWVRRRS